MPLLRLLPFLLLSLPPTRGNAQVCSIHHWGVDFQCLGTSVHLVGNIVGENLFLGGGIGILPNRIEWVLLANRYLTEENTIWSGNRREAHVNSIDQIAFSHLFLRWKPNCRWFEVDGGIRWAVYSRSGYEVDDLGLTRFRGAFLQPLLGADRLKAGFRCEAGPMRGSYYGPEKEFVVIASPMLRYTF
ncbi:MAG: hypothetical protein RLY31_1559 [Bacteroidota bacterium]